MFDQTYFQRRLSKQVAEVGGNPVVTVRLHSGDEHLVRDVVEAATGYVMLNVHPERSAEGIVSPSSSAYSRVPETGFHPMTVAYEAISTVFISSTTAQERPEIGFNSS